MSPRAASPLFAALFCALAAGSGPVPAGAGQRPEFQADLDYAQVEFVRAEQGPDGLWCLAVTVRHRDEGWEHYADAWEALDPDGARLTVRVLAHPHTSEQPFTRQQCAVAVPPGVDRLRVRATCGRHGFGGREILVDLTAAEGEGFTVSRAAPGAER
jgi:hypothetical protein